MPTAPPATGLTPLLKMHTLGARFVPDPIHAGGLRYHGMAPLVSHVANLGEWRVGGSSEESFDLLSLAPGGRLGAVPEVLLCMRSRAQLGPCQVSSCCTAAASWPKLCCI